MYNGGSIPSDSGVFQNILHLKHASYSDSIMSRSKYVIKKQGVLYCDSKLFDKLSDFFFTFALVEGTTLSER